MHAMEVLPLAPPPPPRQMSERERLRLEEQEEDTLRELRLFLRNVTDRLSQDKRFKAFTKPVDIEEVGRKHWEKREEQGRKEVFLHCCSPRCQSRLL